MSDYTGYEQEIVESDFPMSGYGMTGLIQAGSHLDTSKSYSGSKSLLVRSGGVHELLYAAEAGSKTITCRVWPTKGTAKMVLKEWPSREIVDSDVSSGTGAWEVLTIAQTLTARLYVISLENPNASEGDVRAWFDSLEVS